MSQTQAAEDRKKRVLVCEDEHIVALDLKLLVEEFGYEVIGPFATVSSAARIIERERPDMAILDVSLKDGEVYPLADQLDGMGVRLVFHSGHVNDAEISEGYPGAACCQKPVNTGALQDALSEG